ncbi:hypothetical protein [Arenibacter palladensis]|nr:hypothetical protein [Arenibacter palladensis]
MVRFIVAFYDSNSKTTYIRSSKMKFIRTHINLKLFWFLMALHILNLSVDVQDPQPEGVPEDLSYNDMESVVEIILEQVLGIENAIPEYEEDDSGHNVIVKSNFQPIFYQQQLAMDFMLDNGDIAIKHNMFLYFDNYSEQFHPEIVPPPPKA